ncbi:zinc finger, LIM-type protein [Pseudohyphozyma bogoriensis]|nr:zinc finger, LIM-type protein [Pseudohyphozyma bogoriensis]
MTDYFRQARAAYAPPSSRSPQLGMEPSPSMIRKDSKPENSIKCSDCGTWVELMMLGDHVCPTAAKPPVQHERKKRPDMRVDVSGNQLSPGHATNTLARSPSDLGMLGPLTPGTPPSLGSRPTTPGEGELSRSVSSTSSLSSTGQSVGGGKLPFFERYQQMVSKPGTTNGSSTVTTSTSGGLPRSGAINSNLKALSGDLHTPPQTPSPFSQQPSQYATSANSTSLPSTSPLNFRSQAAPTPPSQKFPSRDTSRQPSPSISRGSSRGARDRDPSDLPYASSIDSRSSDNNSRRVEEATPGSSILSSSPPRSRKISLPSQSARSGRSPPPDAFYPPQGDNRATIKVSQSTPSKLSSMGTRSGNRKSFDGSPVGGRGLDACLEDLRLMTEDDDHVMPIPDESQLATPRPPKRSQTIPQSHSSPALSNHPPPMFRLPESEGRISRKQRPSHCTTCRKTVDEVDIQRSGDGQPFCKACYAERYLPKCRKCREPISGGAVTSSDGKVVGKYHPACFSCFTCSEPFPNKEFYVYDMKPYCQHHYHELNGSLCVNKECNKPIEGPCVSLVGEENGGDHPECFKCTHKTCRVPLLEHHFVIERLPYCERHADLYAAPAPPTNAYGSKRPDRPQASAPGSARARKRMTIITR